jgi:hypothetical protein
MWAGARSSFEKFPSTCRVCLRAPVIHINSPIMTSYTDEQLNAELEKLQQNITLTLQAIDHNFAKCHQTIATRIIPQVEKYADASQGVWNGSKVRKHISFIVHNTFIVSMLCLILLAKEPSPLVLAILFSVSR